MNSRQRVEAALNHRQPDRVPLDLGASPVTGMQVSCVYKLRQALGLDKPGTPVNVTEPYQMLGEIAPDLHDALGIDVVGLGGPNTMFGFPLKDWKPWTTFDGTPVLVPGGFNTDPEPNGDILMYPEGDKSVPPSGRMPKGGFYFDSITRQKPIDDAKLNVEDNLEEFGPVSDAALQYFATEADRLRRESDRAILASFGGSAFGDIALVPGSWLKHPKGIRDVAEWYMSTVSRFDYVYEVFDRQCDFALQNFAKYYDAMGDRVSVVFVTGTDFGMQNGPFISPAAYRKLFQPFHRRANDWIHEHTPWKTFIHTCGSIMALMPDLHRRRVRRFQSGPVFGGQHGSAGAQGEVRRQGDVLGRRRRYAEDASLRNAGRRSPAGPRADRHFQSRRRFRVQHDSQRPGRRARRKPVGHVLGRARGALGLCHS